MTALVDASGVALELAHPPRRIVSLIPSTTETLCRLGLSDAPVGVTAYCVEPREVVRTKNEGRRRKEPLSRAPKEVAMADEIRRVDYFYIQVPDQPGEGARALATLREGGVNLLCFCGFPEGRRAQLDFVPEDPTKFREAARKARWKVTGPKKAFLVQGDDRVGAVAGILGTLAEAQINVIATQALCAGAGRYGVLLWVPPRDVARAARVLGAA